MDPNATLARIIDAAIAGDWAMLLANGDELAEWLQQGGFPPADPRDESYQAGRADQRHEFGME